MENIYYRRSIHLESLFLDLNDSIRKLNSYIEPEIGKVGSTTTIKNLSDLIEKLKDTDNIKLKHSIKTCCNVDISNVTQAIENCTNNEKCTHIERNWRECTELCNDVNNEIETMRVDINSLSQNDIINEDTELCKLIQIRNKCYDILFSVGTPLSSEKLKSIYIETLQEPYKRQCSLNSIWTFILISLGLILPLVVFILTLCSCSHSMGKCEKKSDIRASEKELCTERNNNKTTVGCGLREKDVCVSCLYDTAINWIDTLRITAYNKSIEGNGILLFLLNDSIILSDTIMNSNLNQSYTDTSINRIQTTPLNHHRTVRLDDNDHANSQLLFYAIMLILISTFLLFFFLIIRPLLNNCIESNNKQNERILTDRLRIQNEWQQILQDRYCLENRRVEIYLNGIERKSKFRIDKQIRDQNFQHQIKIKRMEYDLEKSRIHNSYKNAESQILDKRLREINEQIVKLMSNTLK